MSTNVASRQPKGVPVGGQFAAAAHPETDTTLTVEPNWGEVNVHEGSRTPWGEADYVAQSAPGIMSVGTPGHGGYKLSSERNKAIPAALRNTSGWYEEDCEAHIVAWVHPEGFPNAGAAEQGVKNWFPDGYEKATGTVLAPGESSSKDRATWDAAHAGDLVVTSASTSTEHPGMVEVTARKAGDGASDERTFLVPSDEYAERRTSSELGCDGRFAVDPSRHQDITKAPVAPTPTTRYTGVNPDALTPAGQQRVASDLAKVYRYADGSVQSVGQRIAAGQMSGKRVAVEDGKRAYYLVSQETNETSESFSYRVSKATWESFSAPDERTPVQRAREDFWVTEHALNKVSRPSSGWRSVAETRKVEAARAAHRAAMAAYKAAQEGA